MEHNVVNATYRKNTHKITRLERHGDIQFFRFRFFFFAKVNSKISRFTVGQLLQLAKKGSGRGGGGGVAGGLIFDFPMRTGRAI